MFIPIISYFTFSHLPWGHVLNFPRSPAFGSLWFPVRDRYGWTLVNCRCDNSTSKVTQQVVATALLKSAFILPFVASMFLAGRVQSSLPSGSSQPLQWSEEGSFYRTKPWIRPEHWVKRSLQELSGSHSATCRLSRSPGLNYPYGGKVSRAVSWSKTSLPWPIGHYCSLGEQVGRSSDHMSSELFPKRYWSLLKVLRNNFTTVEQTYHPIKYCQSFHHSIFNIRSATRCPQKEAYSAAAPLHTLRQMILTCLGTISGTPRTKYSSIFSSFWRFAGTGFVKLHCKIWWHRQAWTNLQKKHGVCKMERTRRTYSQS